MMNQRSGNDTAKRIPWAFLLAAVLALGFEGWNAYFDDYFYTTEVKTTRAAAEGLDGFRMKIKNEFSQKVRTAAEGFDVLVLGDSYFISGVMPKLLERRTGLSTFNFSTFGDHGVFASWCLFRNYVQHSEKKPRFVIIGFQTDTLLRKKVNPAYVYDLKEGNFGDLVREEGWAAALKFQIPSLKHQYLFRGILKEWRFPQFLDKETVERFRTEVIEDRGYYELHADRALAEEVGEEDIDPRFRFSASPSSRENLEKILALAQEHHIQVVYVPPTLSQDWYRLYEEHGVNDGYDRFLEDLEKTFPAVAIRRYQDQIHDLSFYSDRLHLNKLGAPVLTQALAQDILRLSGSPD